jgi:hypothetical protein
MSKCCIACGVDKPLSEFPRNGKDKDGSTAYRADCRECYNIRRSIKKKKHSKFISSTKSRTGEVDTFSIDDWKAAMIYFRGGCAYCAVKQSRRTKMTKEHVIPVSKGGPTVRVNIVPGCVRCNCSKGDSDMATWFRKQSYFSETRLEAVLRWQRMK